MSAGTAMQYEDTNGTLRGAPRGRYGVSVCRCETQPQAVRGANERAQPITVPGNSVSARSSPTDQLSDGTTSESRKTTVSLVAAAQPRLRAPPAWRRRC